MKLDLSLMITNFQIFVMAARTRDGCDSQRLLSNSQQRTSSQDSAFYRRKSTTLSPGSGSSLFVGKDSAVKDARLWAWTGFPGRRYVESHARRTAPVPDWKPVDDPAMLVYLMWNHSRTTGPRIQETTEESAGAKLAGTSRTSRPSFRRWAENWEKWFEVG